MLCLSVVGYMTVADDFRHTGEFAGVSALLVAGLALVGDAFSVMGRQLSMRWVAIGVLLGALLGTAIDATAAGFVAGFSAGLVLARIRAKAAARS